MKGWGGVGWGGVGHEGGGGGWVSKLKLKK